MRAGSLRGAPLARLVSAYYAVHAGPCSVIRIASAWRKKLPTRKCGSAYPNCATCSPECCGAGGTALNTCCIGPSGEDDTNSGPCTATIESADRLRPHSIYNCSTRRQEWYVRLAKSFAVDPARGWSASTLVATRKPGGVKYIGKFIHGGLRSAQVHLNRMLAERDLGRNIRSSPQTVGQFLDHRSEEHTSDSSHLGISYAVFCL